MTLKGRRDAGTRAGKLGGLQQSLAKPSQQTASCLVGGEEEHICEVWTFNQAKMCVPSHVRHFAAPWNVARQAPLSMGFPRLWSGWPCPSPGDLPTQGSNPYIFRLLGWRAGSSPLVSPRKPLSCLHSVKSYSKFRDGQSLSMRHSQSVATEAV